MTCTGTYTVTQADLDAGSYRQHGLPLTRPGPAQACATATVPGVQKPALVYRQGRRHGPSYDRVGHVITYTIMATNTGNVTLNGVTVTDPSPRHASLHAGHGRVAAPAASIICTGTHTLTQADLDAGKFQNTATADSDRSRQAGDRRRCRPSRCRPSRITKAATRVGYNARRPT